MAEISPPAWLQLEFGRQLQKIFSFLSASSLHPTAHLSAQDVAFPSVFGG